MWPLPGVAIADRPRFEWRGLMLDVAPHYMPAKNIKKLIDAMAAHKLNRLHLHLERLQRSGLGYRKPGNDALGLEDRLRQWAMKWGGRLLFWVADHEG